MQQERQFEFNNQGDNTDVQKSLHTIPPSKLMSSLPFTSHMKNSIPQIFSYSQANIPPPPGIKPINDTSELFQLAMEGSHENVPQQYQMQIYPCGECDKPVIDDQEGILCEVSCNRWFHRQCTGLTTSAYEMLTKEENASWVCDKCVRYSKIQARFPRHQTNP